MLTFDQLPLAAIVNGKFFAVHGGIGPAITLESVSSVDRNGEPPREGLMCDLLWSDPVVDKIAYDGQAVEFLPNDTRGCSVRYSFMGVRRLDDIKLDVCNRYIDTYQNMGK